MTWLFSKALMDSVNLHSLPEREAGFSPATCLDGEPYAQWNVMPTPQGFWRNDKMMDACRLSRFGQTCKLLPADHGEAVLKSFLAAFPVKTYPQPEKVRALTEPDPGFGLSSLESLAKYDPATSSWRTPQFSLLGDWEEFSETWPRWGLMRSGECWAQPMWALRTGGTESGLLPTPSASHCETRPSKTWNPESQSGRSLGCMAATRMWPTPTATAYKGWSKNHNRAQTDDRIDYTVEREASNAGEIGRLNPQWVEWLMAFPIGWTCLKPLEMRRFQEWRQQHSLNSSSEDAA